MDIIELLLSFPVAVLTDFSTSLITSIFSKLIHKELEKTFLQCVEESFKIVIDSRLYKLHNKKLLGNPPRCIHCR
jgi:hypothetical protein